MAASQVDPAHTPAQAPPPGVSPNFVHPPSQGYILIAVIAICYSLMLPVVALRVYSRNWISGSFGLDDGESSLRVASGLLKLDSCLHSRGGESPSASSSIYSYWSSCRWELWLTLPYFYHASLESSMTLAMDLTDARQALKLIGYHQWDLPIILFKTEFLRVSSHSRSSHAGRTSLKPSVGIDTGL